MWSAVQQHLRHLGAFQKFRICVPFLISSSSGSRYAYQNEALCIKTVTFTASLEAPSAPWAWEEVGAVITTNSLHFPPSGMTLLNLCVSLYSDGYNCLLSHLVSSSKYPQPWSSDYTPKLLCDSWSLIIIIIRENNLPWDPPINMPQWDKNEVNILGQKAEIWHSCRISIFSSWRGIYNSERWTGQILLPHFADEKN